MIDPPISLTLAFLRTRPDAAAKVLEQSNPTDVSTFLGQIPAESAAPVVARMLPSYAVRIVETLNSEYAASVLLYMETGKMADLIRRSQIGTRNQILEKLPSKAKKQCKALLAYDESQVGAWMNPNPVSASNDTKVGEAIAGLANQTNSTSFETIFVVDRDGLLTGKIPTGSLIAANPDQAISSLIERDTTELPARGNLLSIENSPAWNGRDILPVVDLKKRLIGTLRHSDLRKAMSQQENEKPESTTQHLAPTVFEDYIHTLWTLFTSAIGEYTRRSKH